MRPNKINCNENLLEDDKHTFNQSSLQKIRKGAILLEEFKMGKTQKSIELALSSTIIVDEKGGTKNHDRQL